MEEVKILELTEQCVKFFQDHCYTESRISKYKGLWLTGIIRYMAQNDIEYYSPSVGAGFVSTYICEQWAKCTHYNCDFAQNMMFLGEIYILKL